MDYQARRGKIFYKNVSPKGLEIFYEHSKMNKEDINISRFFIQKRTSECLRKFDILKNTYIICVFRQTHTLHATSTPGLIFFSVFRPSFSVKPRIADPLCERKSALESRLSAVLFERFTFFLETTSMVFYV